MQRHRLLCHSRWCPHLRPPPCPKQARRTALWFIPVRSRPRHLQPPALSRRRGVAIWTLRLLRPSPLHGPQALPMLRATTQLAPSWHGMPLEIVASTAAPQCRHCYLARNGSALGRPPFGATLWYPFGPRNHHGGRQTELGFLLPAGKPNTQLAMSGQGSTIADRNSERG